MPGDTPPTANQPPEISPYVVSVLLAGFGLWCFYDGWINSSPEMQEHLTFNRVGSVILLAWAAWDFWRVRKREQAEKAQEPEATGT